MALVTRGRLVLAVFVISAALVGQRQFATHNTPHGQPPLVDLSGGSLESIRSEFNAASGDVRLIVLLSPT